jgi:hypothetical protein
MEIITNFYQNNYNEYLLNIQNNFLNLLNNSLNMKINSDNNLMLIIISLISLYLFITLGISFVKKLVEFNVLLFISVFAMNFFNKKEVIVEDTSYWSKFW